MRDARTKKTRRWVRDQYSTDANLMKRMRIHRYSMNPVPWFDWVFSRYKIGPGMKILELGCGNCLFWKTRISKLPAGVTLALSDISPGMIGQARAQLRNAGTNISFSIFDAGKIPFNDKNFDIVIANHMLYHVRDVPKTLKEIRRVLRPGGRLYCSTIGLNHTKELAAWDRKFDLKSNLSAGAVARNFGLENGKRFLLRSFRKVRRLLHPDRLEVRSVKPVLDYYLSAGTVSGGVDRLKAHLKRILEKRGSIRITKQTGLFIADA